MDSDKQKPKQSGIKLMKTQKREANQIKKIRARETRTSECREQATENNNKPNGK